MSPMRALWNDLTGRRPMAGLDAVEQYRKLQWGREPRGIKSIDVPHLKRRQDVVLLGWLRAVHLDDGRVLRPPRPYPYLVVGALDNRLYFAGGSLARIASERRWGEPGERFVSVQIDYDSRKGLAPGTPDPIYYYHEHEAPYPWLVIAADGSPLYRGGRYTVRPEGITG